MEKSGKVVYLIRMLLKLAFFGSHFWTLFTILINELSKMYRSIEGFGQIRTTRSWLKKKHQFFFLCLYVKQR